MNRTLIGLSGIGILLALVIVFNYDLLSYGFLQGSGQLRIIMNAKPIEEILDDPGFTHQQKSKIRLIQEVKAFALENGFKATTNYATVYDQQGQVALWNLSACEKYGFEPVQWTFPFLGSFSYKGFFDLEKAKAERQELEDLGYDTRIRSVSAWSTLGWFRDPIMSNMLDRSDGQLAETILHELTHATVFVKDSLQFNENLASFIGEQATIRFLKRHFGDSSTQLVEYLHQKEDSDLFQEHILRGKDYLEDLYADFSHDQPDREERKQEAIQHIVDSLDSLKFHQERYYELFNRQLPNNTYFMSFQRYYANADELNTLFDSLDQSIPKLLEFFEASD